MTNGEQMRQCRFRDYHQTAGFPVAMKSPSQSLFLIIDHSSMSFNILGSIQPLARILTKCANHDKCLRS